MDTLSVRLFRFLSRRNIPHGHIGSFSVSPAERPDVQVTLSFEFARTPFEIPFLDPEPRTRSRVSIGASQGIDEDRCRYLYARWPRCIYARGTVSSNLSLRDPDSLKKSLVFLNTVLNHRKDAGDFDAITDQLASVDGYRWAYFQSQMFDISGCRRPSHSRAYARVKAGDFAGPGLAVIDNVDFPSINEMGWSQAIPFPGARDIGTDLPAVQSVEEKIRLHINSHEDLARAQSFLCEDDIKGCIRFAAPAVEARLRFWSEVWKTPLPKQQLPFDDRIEHLLSQAGKPSYRAVDALNSQRLLYLYRARNSSHEADCYYKDANGSVHVLTCQEHVQPLLEAAQEFCVWIDALV